MSFIKHKFFLLCALLLTAGTGFSQGLDTVAVPPPDTTTTEKKVMQTFEIPSLGYRPSEACGTGCVETYRKTRTITVPVTEKTITIVQSKPILVREKGVPQNPCCDSLNQTLREFSETIDRLSEAIDRLGKNPPTQPPPSTPPALVCCETPKEKYSLLYLIGGFRSIYDSDLWRENGYIGIGYRHHWRDTSQLFTTYAGSELSVFLRKKTDLDCDGCSPFTEENFIKPAARWEVFGGREWGLRQNNKFRFRLELRYALLQPEVLPDANDRRFLPQQSGLTARGQVIWDTPIPGVQVQGGPEYDLIARRFGGELRVIASTTMIAEKAKERKAEEKRKADEEMDVFLQDTSMIQLDSTYFFPAPDTTTDSTTIKKKRFLGMKMPHIVLPFTKEAKEKRLQSTKDNVWKLSMRQNELKKQALTGNTAGLPALAQNIRQLEAAEERLDRLERRRQKKINKHF